MGIQGFFIPSILYKRGRCIFHARFVRLFHYLVQKTLFIMHRTTATGRKVGIYSTDTDADTYTYVQWNAHSLGCRETHSS